jgi:AraC-like DNA-binding protein
LNCETRRFSVSALPEQLLRGADMRRLALARSVIEGGLSLAEAAAEAGFSDQSHLTERGSSTERTG